MTRDPPRTVEIQRRAVRIPLLHFQRRSVSLQAKRHLSLTVVYRQILGSQEVEEGRLIRWTL